MSNRTTFVVVGSIMVLSLWILWSACNSLFASNSPNKHARDSVYTLAFRYADTFNIYDTKANAFSTLCTKYARLGNAIGANTAKEDSVKLCLDSALKYKDSFDMCVKACVKYHQKMEDETLLYEKLNLDQ